MEIVFWVMITLAGIFLYAIGCVAENSNRDIHHDSRPGSFYEISNRKDK